jgi:probable rRNA maturation factor
MRLAAMRAGLTLSLQMPDGRHRALLTRPFVARCIRAALDVPGDITVRVVGEAEALRLNREYRRQGHATNVLTFDYARAPRVHADLVLCAPVVEREAHDAGITVQAHYAHLLVHGALHAQGWDHVRERDARAMQAREADVLRGLGHADPYAAS